MEELQPQDLEELLRELEEEDGVEESLSPEVEELLEALQPTRRPTFRRRAAKQLGEVSRSNRQIVRALVTAAEPDSAAVRAAAAESLRAPVHQEFLQQHPDRMEATERALQQRPGADKRSRRSDTSSVPADREIENSLVSGRFQDRTWALVYALVLIVAVILMFAVSRGWTLMVAGVVWLAGSVLGVVILGRKGYEGVRIAFGLLDFVDDLLPRGWQLVPLALLVLAGPVIMLVALLMRPRDSAAGISKRPARAKDAGRWVSGKETGYRASHRTEALSYRVGAALGALFVRIRRSVKKRLDSVTPGEPGAVETQAAQEGSLVSERAQPSDCPACGAWNAPGSEYCGECGAPLEVAGG